MAQLFRQCHCHTVLKTTKPKQRRCGRCGCLEISGCISLTRLPLISWPICLGLCPKKERKMKKNKKQQRPPNIDQQIRQSRGVACAAKEMGAMRMVFFFIFTIMYLFWCPMQCSSSSSWRCDEDRCDCCGSRIGDWGLWIVAWWSGNCASAATGA